MIHKMIADVTDFHRTFGHPIIERPCFPPKERMVLRHKLINEEVTELGEAAGWCGRIEVGPNGSAQIAFDVDLTMREGDYEWPSDERLAEIGDGIADLIYVLIGMALEYGIPLAEIWDEVQRANMSKLGPDGKPIHCPETGKVLKPAGWQAPDVLGIIQSHLEPVPASEPAAETIVIQPDDSYIQQVSKLEKLPFGPDEELQ